MVKQYIGARYVPVFDGEYNPEKAYEPLTIVTYLNNSYTSKKFVAAGVLPSNTEFWALTGNYNAQVEEYRQEVSVIAEKTNTSSFKTVENINMGVPDVTSMSQGIVRLNKPGLYLFDVNINIPSMKIKRNGVDTGRKITSFEYYMSDTGYIITGDPVIDVAEFEKRKFGFTIHSWDGSPDYDACTFSDVRVKNITEEDFNKRGTGYLDVLIDPFSYNLRSGDDDIDCIVTTNVSSIYVY